LNEVYPIKRNLEFFGRNLRQGGADSRSEVDFAGINGDLPINVDRQKSVEFIG